MANIQVEFNECPRGHGYQMISIGDRRVTGSKCCGSWQTVRAFSVDADDLRKAIDDAENDLIRERARKNRAAVNFF